MFSQFFMILGVAIPAALAILSGVIAHEARGLQPVAIRSESVFHQIEGLRFAEGL